MLERSSQWLRCRWWVPECFLNLLSPLPRVLRRQEARDSSFALGSNRNASTVPADEYTFSDAVILDTRE